MFTHDSRFMLTVWFGGGSLMVLTGITLNDHTELVVIRNGWLTALSYLTFAHNMGQNFILQVDNVRPHVAKRVAKFLNDN